MQEKRRSFMRKLMSASVLGAFPFTLPGAEYKPVTFPVGLKKMKIAYVLFDDLTLLDFIGIYDPLSRIRSYEYIDDFSWDLCGVKPSIKDSFGLEIAVDKIKPDLAGYDMIIVPGGFGTRPLQTDEEFMEWLQTARATDYKVSICTGSLLLGASGLLQDKLATTHYNEYNTLEPYCKKVLKRRIVEDGDVITSGAVASSLDMGLYLCEKLVGYERKEDIRKKMDYHPNSIEVMRNTRFD